MAKSKTPLGENPEAYERELQLGKKQAKRNKAMAKRNSVVRAIKEEIENSGRTFKSKKAYDAYIKREADKRLGVRKPPPTTGAVRMEDRRTDEAKARQAPATSPPTPAGSPSPPGGGAATTAPEAAGAAVGPPVPAGAGRDTAPAANTAEEIERIRQQYGHMAWMVDDPELGPLVLRARQEGWTTDELRGAWFKTNWFRTHGIANVTKQLDDVAKSYLWKLSPDTLREWGLRIVTKQTQPVEFRQWVKEQAKGYWGDFGGALDRGLTVEQALDGYRQRIAQELDLDPAHVDFNEPRWQSLVVKRNPEKNTLVNPTPAEALVEVRTRPEYGWDYTTTGRQLQARFYSEMAQMFGKAA